MRRFSSAFTRSADRGSPAGIPSRTATRPRPCDSPAVVKRNVTYVTSILIPPQPPPTATILHQPPILAREPDSGSGSRDLHAAPPEGEVSPSRRRLRVGVRDGRQRDHHEPARRDPEEILLAGRRVERHPPRADDRVAHADLLLLVEEEGVRSEEHTSELQ